MYASYLICLTSDCEPCPFCTWGYILQLQVTKILLILLCRLFTCLHPHTHSYCSICRGTEVTGCTLYIAASFNVDTPSYLIVVSGFGRDPFRPLVGEKTLKLNCSSRRMVREFWYVYFTVVSLRAASTKHWRPNDLNEDACRAVKQVAGTFYYLADEGRLRRTANQNSNRK